MILKTFFLRSYCVGLFLCLAGETLFGQSPTPTPTTDSEVIKIDTELIDVPVSVADRNGRPLRQLKRSDFQLFEDGKEQEIASFSTVSAPFEVALLLDTSGSTRGDLELIKRSAQLFIDGLRPGDRVAIIAFASEKGGSPRTIVLAPLTSDRNLLRDAILKLTTSNGTPYYDSLVEIMSKVFDRPEAPEFRGRRALVALTDGVDSTSSSDIAEGREMLEAEGIISYFIKVDTRNFFESELLGDCQSAIRFSMAQIRRYYRTVGPGNREQASNFCQLGDFERLAISKALYQLADKEMSELAQRSGGKVFPVGDLSEARNAFRSVATEIGMSYSLGYYPSNENRDGKFRKITVQLKGLPAGTQVRAREGYTAAKD